MDGKYEPINNLPIAVVDIFKIKSRIKLQLLAFSYEKENYITRLE